MDHARQDDDSLSAGESLMGAKGNLISAEENQMCAGGLR